MADEVGRPGRRSDAVGNAALAGLGLAAVVGGLGYGLLGEDGRIGPGFVPASAGAVMVVFATLELARILRPRAARERTGLMASVQDVEQEAADAVDQFGRTDRQRARAIVAIFATTAVGVGLVPFLGLITALSLVVLTLTLGIERRPVLPSALTAVGAAVLAYGVFVLVLNVPVPVGPLGF